MHKKDEYHRKGAGKQKPVAGFLALSMIFTLYSLEYAMKLGWYMFMVWNVLCYYNNGRIIAISSDN